MLIRQKPHHLILIQVSVTRVTFIFIVINIKRTGVTAACHICHNLPPVNSFPFYFFPVQKSGSAAAHHSSSGMPAKSPAQLYFSACTYCVQNIQM